MNRSITYSAFILLMHACIVSGNTSVLEETSAHVHHMWEEWMEMPPLIMDSLREEDSKGIQGTWHGSGTAEEDEELNITIRFETDGKWTSSGAWPDMPDARWYIYNNMVLLFSGSIESIAERPSFITALVMKNGRFFLITADDNSGLIELKRVDQSDPKQ